MSTVVEGLGSDRVVSMKYAAIALAVPAFFLGMATMLAIEIVGTMQDLVEGNL